MDWNVYGKYLKHQSDRDLPDTHFAKGIQKGKLMAKQYWGVLLLMAAVSNKTPQYCLAISFPF